MGNRRMARWYAGGSGNGAMRGGGKMARSLNAGNTAKRGGEFQQGSLYV